MSEHVVTIEADAAIPDRVNTVTLSSLAHHVLASSGVEAAWQISIQFVDDVTMQAAHAEFMDIDEPTDIMTFPYADDDDDVWGESEPGGDLLISVDTARENADVAGWALSDELFFLVTHGLLHLVGWDDHTSEDRSAMLRHQQSLIASWPGRP